LTRTACFREIAVAVTCRDAGWSNAVTERVERYQSWSNCDECGFQGLLEFAHRDGEIYDDPESLGVMLDSTCPACDHQAAVLVVMEEYHAMLRMAKSSQKD
jgi:hypothetical protein